MRIRLVLVLLAMSSLAPCAARAADRYFTTTDGVRLHYIEAGRGGHTIVMVPGWTMPAWIWGAQVADFSRRYHVIAFDPRSQGGSDLAWSGNEPFRRGRDIAELIAQLPDEPVLLVGWSLGVLDSLSYLQQYGDSRLAGLVLVDNSVGEDPPPAPERFPRGPRRAKPPRSDSVRAFVRGMFVRPPPSGYLERLAEAALRTPEQVAAQLLAYPLPRSFWRQAVYSTARPILYIVRPRLGGQAANLVARDPAAESVVLAGVGHAMFAEDPMRFDTLVDDFIRRRLWH